MTYENLQHCVEAVEENNEINNANWSDWSGGSHISDTYETPLDAECIAILDRAVKSEGKSLPVDLRKAELSHWGKTFGGGGYWITVLESKYGAAE